MEYNQLETPRLILRRFTPDDLKFIFNHFANSFVSKYLYDNEPPESLNEAKEILDWCTDTESKHHIRWCIVLKDTEIPIGTIGFHKYNTTNNSAEVGYDLSSEYIRQGYMTEAMKCILDYGFNKYGLNRVQAIVAVENVASNKLLGSIGFTLEGVIRDECLYRGHYYDHNLFSLLKRDAKNK